MRNLAKSSVGNQFNSARKQNSEPVRAHQFNSPTNSNLPAPAPISLEEIRAELRLITGTPLRDHADRLRRQFLWRRLDQLIAARALAWGRR
jgi:hypothetical protein